MAQVRIINNANVKKQKKKRSFVGKVRRTNDKKIGNLSPKIVCLRNKYVN